MQLRSLRSSYRQQWLIVLSLCLAGVILAGVGAVLVLGQADWVQPDGRINQVAHFGGDALYCVDRDFNATNQYSDFGQGGFRLLNSEGQELWFVPAAQISAAVAEAKVSGSGVLVGEGQGSYGPVMIYTYVTGDNDDYFVFSGYDEFGKPNSLTFKFCTPVGPDKPEPQTPPSAETQEPPPPPPPAETQEPPPPPPPPPIETEEPR
jgi:hypothetical protein